MKQLARLVFSFALSALFLWLAFHKVDFALVVRSLRTVRVGYVVLYVAALVLIQILRSLRWELLVRPFAHLSQVASWRISNIGNMLIMLLPLRLGELARPYLMRREVQASFTSTMGAVAVERVVDGLLVVLLFFATTSSLHDPYHVPPVLRLGAFAALGLFTGATALIVIALMTQDLAPRLLRALGQSVAPKLTEKVIDLVAAFVAGLRSLPDGPAVFGVVFYTFAYWVANGVGLYWVMRAFSWQLPLIAGFTLVCVLVIGIMIPAGPGFLGTYQGALIAGLSIFGVTTADAVAYSMVVYPLNLAVVVGFGLPYVFGRGAVHISEMVDLSEQPSNPQSQRQEP